jgi:hypothetical protein
LSELKPAPWEREGRGDNPKEAEAAEGFTQGAVCLHCGGRVGADGYAAGGEVEDETPELGDGEEEEGGETRELADGDGKARGFLLALTGKGRG